MARSTHKVQGFLLHDRRITAANISSAESTYTEAGPRPGPALAADECSQIRPGVHAAQPNDLSIGVVRGGRPGPDTAGLVYKEVSEPVGDYRSWNPPWVLRGCQIIDYDDGTISSEDWARKTIAVVPDTEQLVLAARDVGGVCETWTWAPSTRTWTSNGVITFPGGSAGGLAIVYVPDLCGLLLIGDADGTEQGSVLFSDDLGATWTEYATDVLDTAVISGLGNVAGKAVVDRHGNIFYVRANTGQLQTWVSADGGSTFQEVEDNTGLDADYMDVTVNANGDIVVVYTDGTDNDIHLAILEDAYDLVATAPTTTVAVTAFDVTAFSDADNTIYVFYRDGNEQIDTYRSTDGGATLDASAYFYRADVTGLYPDDFVARMSAGEMIFATTMQHPTTTTQEGSMVILYGGGWDSIEHDATPPATSARVRRGWANVGATNRTWPAVSELPDNAGWTNLVTPATLSINGWNLSTAASIGSYTHTWTHSDNQACVLVEFRVNTGVNQTNTFTGFAVQRRNGTAETGIEIRADTTGFTIHDTEAAADEATVSVDMTDFVQIMVQWSGAINSVTVWYRAHDSDTWTGGSTFTLTGSATASTTSFIQWGHIASGTADSDWRLICYSENKILRHKIGGGTDYDGFRWGRGLDARPYPLRDQGDASYRTRLSVAGSPARRGDLFTITARRDYGVDNLDPQIAPSPKRPWRSTQVAAAEEIVFDLGADTLFQPGSFIGLMLQGECTPRTATLEAKPDGGSYSTIGTYDGATGFEDIEYTLDGDVLVPRVGDVAGRFLRGMEAAGGYVILDGDTLPKVRKIVSNKGGWWQGNGAAPHLRIEGLDGTEKLVDTMAVVMPRGLLLVPLQTETTFRYIKVAFPVQELPDAYVTTGVALVGGVLIPGQGMSRGWSMRWTPNVSSRTDDYGTQHVRQRGPIARELTWSYQDLVCTTALYNDAADHNAPLRNGSDSYLPFSDTGDVVDKLVAMLTETKGGALPVTAIIDLPDDLPVVPTTITDPRAFIYGHLQGQIQANQVDGRQGVDELVRIESLTIREQPWSRD